MRLRLKGIHSVSRRLGDGTTVTYHYAWRGGPRLKGEPGTPEFVASFGEAVKARATPAAGRFHAVIAEYKAAAEFTGLAARTRADYLNIIKVIEVKFGSMPVSAFTERNKAITRGIFKKWRDERAIASRRQADYGWSVLARIISFGVDRGKFDTNPAALGGRLYKVDRADKIWSAEDEAAFLAKAPAHLHLAILLALWTGQRQGDLLRLSWSNYDGKVIRLRQGKTRRRVTIPVGEPLRLALDAEKARKRGALALLTKEGQPWTGDGFRSSWRKACAKAGIEELTFHDMRGSSVTRLALAGATVPEIAALSGHSLKDVESILDAHYLGRDIALAESAVRKLETGTKIVK